jgi:hypothetical protein
VSPQEIVALVRRHLIAVLAVVIVTAGVGYYLKSSTQPYQDSATFVFTSPPSSAFPNPYASFGGSLVEAAGVIAIQMMNSQSKREVSAAGGTAAYNVGLQNSYNLEYPDFSDPDVIVSTSSTDPAAAARTFTAVTQVLERELTTRQTQARVPRFNYIGLRILGQTGPLSQKGSTKRSYAGLLFLAIVAVLSIAGFLDRYSIPLRRLRRPPAIAWVGRITGSPETKAE